MTRPAVFACALLACACSGSPEPAFCEGQTSFDYDPVRGDLLAAFPDDFYTVEDASRLTGLRPHVDRTNAPWLEALSEPVAALYDELDALDGFGTNAGIVLRFSAPLGEISADTVRLVELGASPRRVPYETRLSDDGATVVVWPLRPLRPKTRHAVVVTSGQKDAAGGCVAPSPVLRALLTGEDVPNELAVLAPRYAEALDVLDLAPTEVSAATVFTTASVEEDSLTVAKDVATRTFAWTEPPVCSGHIDQPYRSCTGSFTAGRYVKDEVFVDGTVQSTYEIPVALWLPQGDGPFPVVVFGHGLSDSKEAGESMARLVAPLGIATVAIDAVGHGSHPTSDPLLSPPPRVLAFFGIDLENTRVAPFVLRDHFRASTWDKLQLVRLLSQNPELDGAALDMSRVAYAGLSLGGIMGSELLALSDAFDATALVVPGGRIASIVSDSPAFSMFLEALRGPHMTDGDLDAVVPLLQALIERGDPANYAAHVLEDRYEVGGPTRPHVLISAVIDDETVVNASNHALARAYGVPHLGPVVKPVGLIDVLEHGPVRANLDGRTGAFFQFDRFRRGNGVEKALHGTVWHRDETKTQLRRFFETWLADDAPEIVDPYEVLGTPPLAP